MLTFREKTGWERSPTDYDDEEPGSFPKRGRILRLMNEAETKHGPFTGQGLLALIPKRYGLAFYTVLDSKGRWLAVELGGACYYGLKDLRGYAAAKDARFILDWPFMESDVKDADFMETAWVDAGKQYGWASQWFTWLANDSPWAPAFVTKDWLAAFENGVIYDMSVKGEVLLSAMAGTRYIGETPAVPKTFLALRGKCDNAMMALLAAHHGYLREDRKRMVSRRLDQGHVMWYPGYFHPKKQIATLLSGKLDESELGEKPFNQSFNWNQCVRIFGPGSQTNGGWAAKVVEYQLPKTRDAWEKDMFGAQYMVPGDMDPDEWFNQFNEEVKKHAQG